MATETNYSVNVKYAVDNRGGRKGTSELNDDVRKLDASTRSAGDSFGVLGVAAAAAFGFAVHKAEDALIGFNSRVEASKISLAAMVQGFKGGEWSAAQDNATRMYDEFQKFSVQTPVTTQDIMMFGKSVAAATFAAGGSIKDLTAITEQGVISAKAYGEESTLASLQLSEMVMGNVTSRMRFAKIILGLAKMDEEHFKALSGEQRIKVVRGVLEGDSMKNARDALGESWEGVTSTFKDKLQIVFGTAGKSLFDVMKVEIKSWNQWLDANQVRIDHMVHSLSEGLMTGFGVVKDAVSLLVTHADTIMAMGKIWLAVKIGGMLGGKTGEGSTGLVKSGSALMAWGRGARDSYDEEGNYVYEKAGAGRQNVSLKSAAANAGLIAQSAAVGYALGSLINDATGASHTLANLALSKTDLAFERVNHASERLTTAFESAAARMKGPTALSNLQGSVDDYHEQARLAGKVLHAMEKARTPEDLQAVRKAQENLDAAGVGRDDVSKAGGLRGFIDAMNDKATQLAFKQSQLTVQGQYELQFGIQHLTEYQAQTLDTARAQQDVLTYINSHGMKITDEDRRSIVEIIKKDTEDPEGKHKKMADKPNVNIHIARIEVQSDDPDRMAFGLVEFFRDAAKNPSSAVNALREG
ncbi:MAG TPA: hypothetical protein VLN57_21185 [Xanthobacteraceae bacterium]|nr:hypothetical protein [Xanthobacteraceae bacterium]